MFYNNIPTLSCHARLDSVSSSIFILVENDMDGEAVSLAFASCSGPDCIKDVIPKYGLRLKVYQAIKREIEASAACSSGALVHF